MIGFFLIKTYPSEKKLEDECDSGLYRLFEDGRPVKMLNIRSTVAHYARLRNKSFGAQ